VKLVTSCYAGPPRRAKPRLLPHRHSGGSLWPVSQMHAGYGRMIEWHGSPGAKEITAGQGTFRRRTWQSRKVHAS
jgi:hypothetical protein